MKCPRCGAAAPKGARRCPRCGRPFVPVRRPISHQKELSLSTVMLRVVAIIVGILIAVSVFGYAAAKLHYWNYERKIRKDHKMQSIEPIVTDRRTSGHAITFFGDDGDTIFIEELREAYQVTGGIARVEFEDASWFSYDPTNTEYAVVTLSPVRISATGERTKLPPFTMQIDVPSSPLTIKNPPTDELRVITSTTALDLSVVYGSTVIINGEDVTDKVDKNGDLSLNLTVLPQGENYVSVLVRTPYHRETRHDLIFHRDALDIYVELDSGVASSSTLSYMTVSGTTEPGAWIEVDSNYDKNSLVIDQETGRFSFKAMFDTYGNNLVRFHATMAGRNDSNLSFYVHYVPSLAEYSRRAWKMSYDQLRAYYEQWLGRIFLCKGQIQDSFVVDNVPYVVMDVGEEETQLLVLQNQTNYGTLDIGTRYAVYGDVIGRYFYKDSYIPMLIGRYASND